HVVMGRRHEGIHRAELCRELIHRGLAEAFERGVDEMRIEENAGGVLRGKHLPERRRNEHPPFAIERSQHRRNERLEGHGARYSPSGPWGLGGGLAWAGMAPRSAPLGRSGIAWDNLGGQSKNRII